RLGRAGAVAPAAATARRRPTPPAPAHRRRRPGRKEPTMTTSPTSPERLMQLMWGYAPPLILEAALKIGVFDRLDRQPATAAQLAADAGATERGMRILTDALVALGFAARDAEGR